MNDQKMDVQAAPGGGAELMQSPLHQTKETAIAAVEAHAKAAVQARWIMAMERPRDLDQVRERLLRECKRPAFAEVARYELPRGGKTITGPTIRFAEAAIRCMTNVYIETPVVFDDAEQRILKLQVTDLETNVTYGQDITVPKEIERRSLAKGQKALRTRVGAAGQRLYILRASDDEILQTQNALVSKALRTHGLRHLPGWLYDEAEQVLAQTARQAAKDDPDAAKRRILDSFYDVGVRVEALKEYMGHDLDVLKPDEIVELRGLYQAIREGQTSFVEALEQKHGSQKAKDVGTSADQKAKDAIDEAQKKGGNRK